MNDTIQKRRFCLLKQSFNFKSLSLHFFYNLDLILRIKGSRAVNDITGCSSRNTSRTRTIYTSFERLYFSSSYDIKCLLLRLELKKLQI